MKKSNKTLLRVILLALFSAMSFVLFLLEFPVIPGLSYLKLDLSDIPALIGAVIFGPVFGVLVELFKNILELSVKGIGTQMGFGNLMNFIVGCAFIVPFSIIFRKITDNGKCKQMIGVIIAGFVSLISIVAIGIVGNYLIAPLFFKYFLGVELSDSALWTAIWGATALNAVKGVMLWVVAIPLVAVIRKRLGHLLLNSHN
ncbi:MAG TPA: ECF transporter S component [Clostridia bacterium]|nr:ECF transporter S component [Clostridia bacterium]